MVEKELTIDIIKQLSEPFPPEQVNLLVKTDPNEKGNSLIVPYIDARDVIGRLNEVVPGDWSDAYRDVKGGTECALTIYGVTRCDVGDADNRNEPGKTGYSDSLKRAAVKFGIGGYLYELPRVWGKVRQVGNGKAHVIDSPEEERRIRSQLFKPMTHGQNGSGASKSNGHGDHNAFWLFVRTNGLSKTIAEMALSDSGGDFDKARSQLENQYQLKAA